MSYSYEDIKPLIVSESMDGMMIKLQFKAENQEQPMDAVAVLMPSQDQIMKNVAQQTAKTAATNAGINAAASGLGSMLGGAAGAVAGAAGSQISNAVSQQNMSPENLMKGDFSQEEKETAIVNCFMNYASYYELKDGKWHFKQAT
ncbi:MAG: hypothetical protein EP338_04930 [Bacteroidetes bacterium]|nr:MAG: hypothetical protein EP338_04930 [Bacteroidota bacterium]